MSYRIAGIDVHKKMLAVVVSDVEGDGEFQFEGRLFGGSPGQLRSLAKWLVEQEAEEVVMESTAQYWKPVWGALEQYWQPERQKREGARKFCLPASRLQRFSPRVLSAVFAILLHGLAPFFAPLECVH